MKPAPNRNDLVGKTFGSLRVVSFSHKDKGSRTHWLCECECGKTTTVEAYNLKSGHTTSCGCKKYTEKYGKDIIGVKFGRATALRQFVEGDYTKVECLCVCGNKFITHRCSLVGGHTNSCGCLQKEVLLKTSITHGMSGTRIYEIWSDMRSRCNLTTNQNYYRYGGRGIKVCSEWDGLNGFANFYEWAMQNGYKDILSIDRIDNNGGYSPENCRWSDMMTQCNNRRNSKFLEYNGQTKTLAQWVRELNLNYTRTYHRVFILGWSVKSAFEDGFYHATYNPE